MKGTAGPGWTSWTIGPPAVVLALLFVVPMGIVALYAFLTPGPLGAPELPFTFAAIRRSLDPLYLGILLRSLRLALLCTVICLVVGFPVAWILTGMRGRVRNFAILALILPSWTNLLVKNYAWIVLLRQEGIVNSLMLRVGLINEPLPLLFNEGAVLIGLAHTFLPFMVLPLYAALDKLDPAHLEAARDLGAGPWSRLRYIVLPQCRAGVAAGSLLVFIPALGSFVTPDLLGGARGMMVGNLIQNQMLLARDWPFGSALSLWLMAVTLVLILLSMRLAGGRFGGKTP